MSSEAPAVVVAKRDGTVMTQNAPARRLMGPGKGSPCWDVVGGLKRAEGLPCERGCVGALLNAGVEHSQHNRLKLAGERHHLTCIPVGELVVCMLSPGSDMPPKKWQLLTAREQEVLQLLSVGETTSSAAVSLGISESTVRTHVEKMRTKLGVGTRAALVALAFRLGYLD